MTTVDELTRAYGPPPEPEPERPRMSRGKRLAIFVAFLIGLPAIALAATYLFGTITGEATFLNGAGVHVSITAVTASEGPEGVDCRGRAAPAGAGVTHLVNESTVALYPQAPRQQINGGAYVVPGGSCTVLIKVYNEGLDDLSVKATATLPSGWTFSAPVVLVPTGVAQDITATITAAPGDGVTTGALPGSIVDGTITIDIPPTT